MRSWFAIERLSIIPNSAIAECKASLIWFYDLMALGTGDMISCQFDDLAIIFSWSDDTANGFMFVPGLMNSSEAANYMVL